MRQEKNIYERSFVQTEFCKVSRFSYKYIRVASKVCGFMLTAGPKYLICIVLLHNHTSGYPAYASTLKILY